MFETSREMVLVEKKLATVRKSEKLNDGGVAVLLSSGLALGVISLTFVALEETSIQRPPRATRCVTARVVCCGQQRGRVAGPVRTRQVKAEGSSSSWARRFTSRSENTRRIFKFSQEMVLAPIVTRDAELVFEVMADKTQKLGTARLPLRELGSQRSERRALAIEGTADMLLIEVRFDFSRAEPLERELLALRESRRRGGDGDCDSLVAEWEASLCGGGGGGSSGAVSSAASSSARASQRRAEEAALASAMSERPKARPKTREELAENAYDNVRALPVTARRNVDRLLHKRRLCIIELAERRLDWKKIQKVEAYDTLAGVAIPRSALGSEDEEGALLAASRWLGLAEKPEAWAPLAVLEAEWRRDATATVAIAAFKSQLLEQHLLELSDVRNQGQAATVSSYWAANAHAQQQTPALRPGSITQLELQVQFKRSKLQPIADRCAALEKEQRSFDTRLARAALGQAPDDDHDPEDS